MRVASILVLALIVAAPVAAQEVGHALKGGESTTSVQVSLRNELLNTDSMDRTARATQDLRSEFQRGEFINDPPRSEQPSQGGPSTTTVVVVVVAVTVVVAAAAALYLVNALDFSF